MSVSLLGGLGFFKKNIGSYFFLINSKIANFFFSIVHIIHCFICFFFLWILSLFLALGNLLEKVSIWINGIIYKKMKNPFNSSFVLPVRNSQVLNFHWNFEYNISCQNKIILHTVYPRDFERLKEYMKCRLNNYQWVLY